MSKQSFDNAKYSPAVCQPLHNFLFVGSRDRDEQLTILTSFNKKDKQFHDVVAWYMWTLANSLNLSWGCRPTQPLLYSPYDKVLPQNNDGFLYHSFFFLTLIYYTHMCDRTGSSRMGSVVSSVNSTHEHDQLRFRCELFHRYVKYHQCVF